MSVRPDIHLAVLAALLIATTHPVAGEERGLRVRPAVVDATAGIEGKLALIIGNGAYEGVPLRNPKNDAMQMNQLLIANGFETILRVDADHEAMDAAVREFGERLRDGGVGLFYYAGHGLQVDGRNFLIPVGTSIRASKDVKYRALDLGEVMDEFAGAENRLNIIILDACRDNPFRGFRGGSRGLARTDAPRGTIIAYATAPGSVAADGGGDNGIYTSALLDAMRVPGLPIEQVFKRARISVLAETDGLQTPWDSSSLTGEFYFTPGSGGARFDAADLDARARSAEEKKAAWDATQQEMEEAFEGAEAYEKRNLPYGMRAEYWSRFASAFAPDNPYSRRDDALREQARQRIEYWSARSQKEARVEVARVEELDRHAYRASAEAGARAAISEYESAYEAQDIQRLAAVWIMNRAQRESMESVFECADDVSVEVRELGLDVGDGSVSVYLEQKLSFTGPECMMKAPGRPARVTATVIDRGSAGWSISSVLPSRD